MYETDLQETVEGRSSPLAESGEREREESRKPGPVRTPNGHSLVSTLFSKAVVLVAVDLGLGFLAYFLSWILRINVQLPWTQALLPQERWDVVPHPWISLILTQVFFLYILGLYDDLRVTRVRELIAFLFTACVGQVVTITSLFYLASPPEQMQQIVGIFPRSVILLFGLLNFLALAMWRLYVKWVLQQRTLRVLVVGEDAEACRDIVEEIERNPWMGLKIVGLAVGESAAGARANPHAILGGWEEIQEIVFRHNVDEIIFASHESWKDRVLHSLSQLQIERPLRIAILPSVYEIAIGRLRHINIHDTPLIEVRRHPNEPLERFLKRSFDLLFSAVCLVLLLPLLGAVALLIKLTAPGPVFYLQDRVGYGGKVFRLIKFRTMIPDAERGSGETYSQENDPRVTPIGRWLRRFRLDELPQLINVLKGDMSFVGPRPERPGFAREFAARLPGYNERHKVKPGITGLAQVRGYYHTAAENKLKYDLAYIYNYSFSLDLLILLETIKVILIRRGS